MMTETLRRACSKVLRASFDEVRERFNPERLALCARSSSGDWEVVCSHGYSDCERQLNREFIKRCGEVGGVVKEAVGDRRILAAPMLSPGSGSPPAVFLFDVPEAESAFLREDLFSIEALIGRAAADVAVLTRRLVLDKKRVLPAPDQVDTWSGIRKAGLEAYKAGVNDMALSFLERARDMAEEWGPCPELFSSLNALGEVLRANDRPEEAAEQFQRGVSVLEQAGMDREARAVPILNNYAGILYSSRELEEAEEYYRRALDIVNTQARESKAGPAILANLGVISVELGDSAAAKVWLEQALAAASRIYGEDHPNTAKCRQKLEAILHSGV